MKATPGEKILESGKIKYMVYTDKNKDEKVTVRVIIGKLFRLSNMDDLKIVFVFKIVPNSGKTPIEVLSEYVEKYGTTKSIILMDTRIANPYFETSNYAAQQLFKKECTNLGFCNVIWNACIGKDSNSTDWLIFGNDYANEWMSSRIGIGEGEPSDGKIIRRIIIGDPEPSNIE